MKEDLPKTYLSTLANIIKYSHENFLYSWCTIFAVQLLLFEFKIEDLKKDIKSKQHPFYCQLLLIC